MTDAKRMVNTLLMHVIRTEDRHYVLHREAAHPLLTARIREMASMATADRQGAITVSFRKRDWRVLSCFVSAGRIELSASPADVA